MSRAKTARVPITEQREVDKHTNSRRAIIKALPAYDDLKHFLRQDEGLTITEYAIAAGLIAATIAATFGALGATIDATIKLVIGFL